jgi:hypothetical protein
MRYALKIEPGLTIRSSTSALTFLVNNSVDFGNSTVENPTEISVFSLDANGAPNYFLAKKTVPAIGAQRFVTSVSVGSAEKFFKTQLIGADIIGIESVVDSNGNLWYEVPYLAQDTIFEQVENTSFNDPDAAVYSQETPYLLKLKKVPRRFVTRVNQLGIELQFGAGVSSSPDEELIALPENISLTLPTGKLNIDASIDPQAPVFTGTYGLSPSNTTLTITYLIGAGVAANVPSNALTTIENIVTNGDSLPDNIPNLRNTIISSLAVNNPTAAVGGRGPETIEELRQNTLAQFTSQNRAVTREDYIVRAYAMPNIYGSIAKVYIAPDEQGNLGTSEVNDFLANPLALNMYVLSYNSDKQLTIANRAIKENLKTYMSQYKMLTDSINIRDGYVINIGVDVDIIPLPNFNVSDVLISCIESLQDFFNIDRWQINEPLVSSDLFNLVLQVRGVQTVTNIAVKNLNDSTQGYSDVYYDIKSATVNGIIYPSLDPSIFEVKYPNNDIKVRAASY